RTAGAHFGALDLDLGTDGRPAIDRAEDEVDIHIAEDEDGRGHPSPSVTFEERCGTPMSGTRSAAASMTSACTAGRTRAIAASPSACGRRMMVALSTSGMSSPMSNMTSGTPHERACQAKRVMFMASGRSEEHTSELQSRENLV